MKHFMLFLLILFITGCSEKPEIIDTVPEHVETTEEPVNIPEHGNEEKPRWSPIWSDMSECEDKEVIFSYSPLNPAVITYMEPQGELTDRHAGHIIPGDHIGIQYGPGVHDFMAIADGHLVRIERQPASSFYNNIENFHMYFEHSCKIFTGFVHVNALSQELLDASPELKEFVTKTRPTDTESLYPRVPVRAGQILGSVQDVSLLGMLTVDTDVELTGFVNPENYLEGEPWKTHAVAPFDYFETDIKEQLLAKNPRTKEPRGGKIDFDIDGRLVGNWFLENTGGFRGDQEQAYCGDYLCPYWDGHLAFVYDFVDPDQVRISIGYDTGIEWNGPYGVIGPDPKDVSVASGLVNYKLLRLVDVGPEANIQSQGKALLTKSSDTIVGYMLVEMLTDRKIKVEVATDPSFTVFTDNARVYKR